MKNLSEADAVVINAIRQDGTLYWSGFKEEQGTIDQRGGLLALHQCGGGTNTVGIKIDGIYGLFHMGTESATKHLNTAVIRAIGMLKRLQDGEIVVCEEGKEAVASQSIGSFC